MRHDRVWSSALLVALFAGARLAAQLPTDSARCREMLATPPRDSMLQVIGMRTSAFDPDIHLPAEYTADLTQQIRSNLRVPPLRLGVYTMATPAESLSAKWASIVVPTLSAAYRMTARRNGTVTNARVVGGARIEAFDAAFLAAVKALNDSTAFPFFPSSIKADSIELRLVVRQDNLATVAARDTASKNEPTRSAAKNEAAPAVDPLFRLKVPMLGRGNTARAIAGQTPPRYPEVARLNNVQGEVQIEFIVGADGIADLSSVQVAKATALEFVESVFERLPQLRFKPMELNGCPLAEVVSMPFQFRLRR